MENFEQFKDAAKEAKEIRELVEKYLKLQVQINNPTRDGMIEALSNAQSVAPQEITILEQKQGDIYQMPWTSFQDYDLYRKLSQYQQGLYNHAVNKFDEELVKMAIKQYAEASYGK